MNSWKKYISEINLSQKDRSVGFLFVALGLIIATAKFKKIGEWSIFLEHYLFLLVLLVVVFLVSLVRPKWLRPISLVWFFFGWLLNLIFSPIIMGGMYFLVLTPFGLCRRLFAKKTSGSKGKVDEVVKSYWIQRDPPGPPPDSLKMQF